MSVASACYFQQSGTRSTTQQPSCCMLATRSVFRPPQLQITHRAAMQHGRSSSLAVSGHAGLNCVSSTKNLGSGSLSHPSSKRDFAVVCMSAAEGAQDDASCVPRATRKQLDQFFTALSKEKNIATEQNCDEADVFILEDVAEFGRWIGYCYYTVSAQGQCAMRPGFLQ
jgi:hypothetical protein